MRHKLILLTLIVISGLLASCQANKLPNTEDNRVIPIIEGEPQPASFEGTYTIQKGTCGTEYQKLGVAKTGDGAYDVYGLEGTEAIHLEVTDKNACFEWDESDCCLVVAETSLTLTCTLPDASTCESIYEKNTSTFDINTVFSAINSTAISAEPVLFDRRMDDVAAEVTKEGTNITAIGTKERATFDISKVLLKEENRLFKRAGLNIFVPAFAASEDLKKYPLDLHKEGSCCDLIGARFVYDRGTATLYRLTETDPAAAFLKFYIYVSEDVYSPRHSNESIWWFNSSKKLLTIIPYDSSVMVSYDLPGGVDILDAAVVADKTYLLVRAGQAVDVRVYDAPSKQWKSLGLNYGVPDPIFFSHVKLLAKGEAVAVSLKNIFLIKTCSTAAWENYKLRRGNMIVYMTADGLFASDTGRFYVLDKAGGMKVSFTLDMFVQKQFETESAELLPNTVGSYFEDASRLYFSVSTVGQPTRNRYLGWLQLAGK